MSEVAGISSVSQATTDGGRYEVYSTHESAKDIEKNLAEPGEASNEEDEDSKAASRLGKKGGEAAAKARKEAAKEAKADKPEKAEAEDEGEADEDPDEAPRAAKDDKRGNPKHDPKARIQQLATQRREAAERAQRLEEDLRREREERQREREEYQRRSQPQQQEQRPQPQQRQAAPDDDPEPKADDYEDYALYLDARTDWRWRQNERRAQQERAQQQTAQTIQRAADEAVQSYRGQLKAAHDADPDFLRKVEPVSKRIETTMQLVQRGGHPSQAQGSHFVADHIFNSDVAPALLLYLSEHPDDLQRIASLPSRWHVAREMGKVEARLEGVTTATTPKPEASRAKPPVRSVAGAPSADDDSVSDGDDYEAHKRKMNAEDAKARAARRR